MFHKSWNNEKVISSEKGILTDAFEKNIPRDWGLFKKPPRNRKGLSQRGSNLQSSILTMQLFESNTQLNFLTVKQKMMKKRDPEANVSI